MTNSPEPGRLVFCHGTGIIAKAIRLGEWIRFRPGDTWNHVGVLNHQTADGDWVVIEATARGVTSGRLSTIAPGGRYEVVALPAGVNALAVLAFARSQVGQKYGWLSVLSVAVEILTPRWFHLPSFRSQRTWICSALAGEAVRCGGWIQDWPTIYGVVPSSLYEALQPPPAPDVPHAFGVAA